MKRRDVHLEQLFLVGLSLAAAACAAAPPDPIDVGSSGPVGSGLGTPTTAPRPTSSSGPSTPPDDSTPAGYARAYRSAGHYEATLSGLELVGFVDVVDDALLCEGGRPCPSAWDGLKDGTFERALVVKKRASLAVISPKNFFEWVGPVDGGDRAALRVRIEPRRAPTTCAKLAELGYACAPGSEAAGIPVRAVENGWEVATFDERNVCGGGGWSAAKSLGAMIVDREGRVIDARNILTDATDAKMRETVKCQYVMEGRRYEGWVDGEPDDPSVAGYLSRCMREEAAAAIAFERLADDLAEHGAPAALVRDAREAAKQEVRHAAMFRAELARIDRREGHRDPAPAAPDASAFAGRTLLAVLLENATEGCANETFAAVVATHRGQHAPHRRRRTMFARIARDEQTHAALSHRIHAWGRAVLGESDRRALDAAFDEAVARFAAHGETRPTGAALGEPSAVVARAAFAHVASALASA